MANNIPLSLYIHFPWCVKKCPYCDFNSHELKNNLPEEKYIKLLLKDFKADLPRIKNRKIHSIFMGGGTPSLFSPKAIHILLKSLQDLIEFDHPEITLEANPGTVEQEKFNGFREAGINRLSIGIQSFNKHKLKKLGRIHDDEAALRAIEAAKKAGFENFNIDLMHGLPDQTVEEALFDLQTAISFNPPHLSWYQLTLEPNTLFYQKPPVLPVEGILSDIFEQGHQLLIQHYQHYEVSAYCQKNYESQHNLNYWQFGDYIGIGAGAHGKITLNKKIIRTQKLKHPKDYLNNSDFLAQETIIEEKQLPFEFMLNALRLQKPILFDLFEQRTFLNKKIILPILERLQHKKLVDFNSESFEAMPLGKRFLNDLLVEFMM